MSDQTKLQNRKNTYFFSETSVFYRQKKFKYQHLVIDKLLFDLKNRLKTDV